MWIDTHNHFDFSVFDATRTQDWEKAQSLGVSAQLVMSVAPHNFCTVAQLATQFPATYFALGIHPHYIDTLDKAQAIAQLKQAVIAHRDNPRFVGIGEIGLDGFLAPSNQSGSQSASFDRQVRFFSAQLRLAREFDLPVFMHVRKAQDKVLKYCRQFGVGQGIAHAFNGSHQQADRFLTQGFKLGFGGAFTYERAKQLRRLVVDLPLEAFVLETDAPDMPPAWLYSTKHKATNYSHHLPEIAEQFAALREIPLKTLSKALWENSEQALCQALVKPKNRSQV